LIGLAPPFGLDAEAREGTRAVGPFIAVWYLIFMIPFFLWIREAPRPKRPGGVRVALLSLGRTIRGLPQRGSLFAYLGSSLFYRDALVSLYSFGGTYALLVLNWSITQVGIFGIIGAITAALACWLGGRMEMNRGPKAMIGAMIGILICVCAFVLGLTRDSIWGLPLAPGSGLPDIAFFVCGAIIGGAGGVLQASSRSMMVRQGGADRPTEAFGLYALAGKATAFSGPLLIDIATTLSGSARMGMVPLIILFIIGLALLSWVKPEGEPLAEGAQTV
ncbi:MAG: MFS transporter, partial [Pseudomonadota bacterium]